MARHSEVNWYASKQAYMTTFRGVRYTLERCDQDDKPDGPHYRAALAEFQRILEGTRTPDNKDDTVGTALERFLFYQQQMRPKSYPQSMSLLSSAVERFKRVPVQRLMGRDVYNWIDSQQTWGPCTRCSAFQRFKEAMRYNLRFQYIAVNPIEDLACPPTYHYTARGAEFVIPDELVRLLLMNAPHPYSEYLLVLARTGARPGEIANAEHYHYRPEMHAILFEAKATRGYRHKTSGRKKRGQLDRIIYLDDECEEIVRRNAKHRGFLLPNSRGGSYSKLQARRRLDDTKRRPQVVEWMEANHHQTKWVVPYSFRHTWITKALKQGLPIKTVADLCGNSVKAIEEHYGHAAADVQAMRKAYLSVL